MIKPFRKGNPKWVREMYGKYRWEYQKDGKYYAEGWYKTAQEAHEECVKHQEMMDLWRNPQRHKGVIHTASGFNIGDKCWTFLANMTGHCTLDAFSLKTFWIEEWEIINIREGALRNQDLKIFMIKNIRGWINPRETISDCCYKSRDAAISGMRKKLREIEA